MTAHFSNSYISVITDINQHLIEHKFGISDDIVTLINMYVKKEVICSIRPRQIDWWNDQWFMEDAGNFWYYYWKMGFQQVVSISVLNPPPLLHNNPPPYTHTRTSHNPLFSHFLTKIALKKIVLHQCS